MPTKNPAACFLEGGDREDTSVVVVDSPQWGVIVSRRSTLRDPSLLVSYSAGYNQFQHAKEEEEKYSCFSNAIERHDRPATCFTDFSTCCCNPSRSLWPRHARFGGRAELLLLPPR